MLYKLRLVDGCFSVSVYTDALYGIIIPYIQAHDIYHVSGEYEFSDEDIVYLRLLLPEEVEIVRSEMGWPIC